MIDSVYSPHRTATAAWYDLLARLLRSGHSVAPRGKETLEVLSGLRYRCDLDSTLIADRTRKLNYSFAAAEALWIIDGRRDLAPLIAVNPRMVEFSDDGVNLAGAYGPKIVDQLPYVVDALLRDRDSRQAVLTIWERKPAASKDIPCTIAMTFSVRENALHLDVMMRSSDAWLGIPYDSFSFGMVGVYVACLINKYLPVERRVRLGKLTITPVSSHLYVSNISLVHQVLAQVDAEGNQNAVQPIPPDLIRDADWEELRAALEATVKGLMGTTRWLVRPWSRS